jgi:hypothetical protein
MIPYEVSFAMDSLSLSATLLPFNSRFEHDQWKLSGDLTLTHSRYEWFTLLWVKKD